MHLDACLYYKISANNNFKTHWSLNKKIDGQNTNDYILAFYWAFMTILRITDKRMPYETEEFALHLFNLIMGTLLVSAIIGQFQAVISNARKAKVLYKNQLEQCLKILAKYNVDEKTSDSVRLWFQTEWNERKTVSKNLLRKFNK